MTDGNVKTLIYALSCAWNLSGNGMHILIFELKEEAHEYYAWCFSTVKCICIEVFSSFDLKMDFEIEVVTTLVKKIVDS